MAHYYHVPFAGRDVGSGAYEPVHRDPDADVHEHHVGSQGVVAITAEKVESYETLADDADSGVRRLDPEPGTYPSPDFDGGSGDDSAEKHACEECGDVFDSAASLRGHMASHSG